jgi:hypothetical protein
MYADYSQIQSLLTLLIEAIAILGFGGCIVHSVLKEHLELSKIYQEVPSPQVTEVVTPVTPVTPVEETPAIVETPVVKQKLDIENLKLRPARKLAVALKIKQKVNGKDQPLPWLRAQIKKALQDKPELVEKAVEIVHRVA